MWIDLLGALLAPERCAACDEPVPLHHAFCACCAVSIEPADFEAELPGEVVEIGAFGGALIPALHRLKYQGRTDLGRPLGDLMARAALQQGLRVEQVIPVPLAPRRLQERGYNQAALLAARVARHLGAHHEPLALQRRVETGQLAHLDQHDRQARIRGAFACARPVRGRSVLLVDDVMTTGSTLGECTEVLYEAGARSVAYCVAARVERRDRGFTR
ncbi:MAG: ComF family protein [Polyangiaceae bacterium]|jgi:ComF family protein|nr:ComF family protein [Polyangiaceae bacterium]